MKRTLEVFNREQMILLSWSGSREGVFVVLLHLQYLDRSLGPLPLYDAKLP